MENEKPSKKKQSKQKTLVTLLLDRSGSMGRLRRQTIDAINAWTGELRGSGLDIRFSQVHFDFHQEMCLERLHVGKKISEVPVMTEADFQPRGMTPLIDAAVDTINAVKASIEGKKNVKVIIAIQTDGEENCSTRHTWAQLKILIDERQQDGWEFVFMGAGINAYQQGALMGIGAGKTISYGNDAGATREAFRSTAMNTVAYASGLKADLSYSSVQKAAAGDRFDAEASPAADVAGPALSGIASPALGGLFGVGARSMDLRPSRPDYLAISPDLLAQLNALHLKANENGASVKSETK